MAKLLTLEHLPILMDEVNNKIDAIPTATDTKGKNIVGASANSATNGAVSGTGGVYLNHVEGESDIKSSHKIIGTGITKVTSDASGNITINTPSQQDSIIHPNSIGKINAGGSTFSANAPNATVSFVGANGITPVANSAEITFTGANAFANIAVGNSTTAATTFDDTITFEGATLNGKKIIIPTPPDVYDGTLTLKQIAGSGDIGVKSFSANDSDNITFTVDAYTKTEVDTKIAEAIASEMTYKGTTSVIPSGTHNHGDCYKITADIAKTDLIDTAVKVGDTIIWNSNDNIFNVIPSGNDVEDTWRTIKVNNSQILGSTISSGDVNFKDGAGINIIGSGSDITIKHSNIIGANPTISLVKLAYDTEGHITNSSAVTKEDIVALGISDGSAAGGITSVLIRDNGAGTTSTVGSVSISGSVLTINMNVATEDEVRNLLAGLN